MNTRDLLFELGTEELPPKALHRLMTALRDETASRLEQADLAFATIDAYAAPRRLALLVHDLTERQPDKTVERRGPALKAAFDADGKPTPAALGFAKSCGVAVKDLETLENDKGAWLLCRIHQPGRAAAELAPDILRQALAALPIPKRMRWGAGEAEFVRPVHWAVLLFGETVIETEMLGVTTGNATRGHRFHCPRPLTVTQPDHYPQLLLGEGRVIADFGERREHIRQQAEKLAREHGGRAHIDADLLDEVTALVEWPVGLVGTFEERFLELPKEVLVTVMQSHQKYFPVLDPSGALLPRFVTFANLDSKNPDTVRAGNERVIRPRLSDAEFFWNQDLKIPLERHLDKLAGIIFQKRLGTLLDKTRRLEKLSEWLAPHVGADPARARRAARLAKTDLVTDMVGEFPELQGIMGRYYAQAQGEDPEVAAALEEQYLPRFAGDRLPKTPAGRTLALADKLDTLVGIFSIGQVPTGAKDPYALRRAALGIIRIIIEGGLELDLKQILSEAANLHSHDFDPDATTAQVFDFILERLRGYLAERGFRPDAFEAVAAVAPAGLLDFLRRIEAVHAFRRLPEAEALAAANKRIRNILRQAQLPLDQAGEPDPARFDSQAEHALYRELLAARTDVEPLLAKHDYTAALKRLAQLRDTVDAFYDQVMVMVEDTQVRRNRLDLLAQVARLFLRIADISRLQG
ncbi:glycyl-tRNA synthetase beta chain [Methylomarinovum caldicuralii]|uniref:Glycine--tRNA ligase beta subunit n=1 Tax=Methylomarinovum caldicuralii TaxID=438856 RepID=A0AAU9CXG3_9GAMM|nr:glycine--tRNA ligase subunit beta [Methylomarinovum caldicuralii]BCX82717.1 glycyl-tRNA synthetase beta chain [Methylomarinovum caldicuralii]